MKEPFYSQSSLVKPFLGRGYDLTVLGDALRERRSALTTREPDMRIIGGPRGAGKTQLGMAFLKEAKDRGAQTMTAALAELDPVTTLDSLAKATARARDTGNGTVALFIDDAHLLHGHPMAFETVRALLHGHHRYPVLLVLAGLPHLARVINTKLPDHKIKPIIRPQRLKATDVFAYLEHLSQSIGAQTISPALAETVVKATEGHPAYVGAYAEGIRLAARDDARRSAVDFERSAVECSKRLIREYHDALLAAARPSTGRDSLMLLLRKMKDSHRPLRGSEARAGMGTAMVDASVEAGVVVEHMGELRFGLPGMEAHLDCMGTHGADPRQIRLVQGRGSCKTTLLEYRALIRDARSNVGSTLDECMGGELHLINALLATMEANDADWLASVTDRNCAAE